MSEKKTERLDLTPMQLAAVLVIESQIAQLQIAANQLGGWLKLTREADILVNAMQIIVKDTEKLKADWAKQVKIFPEAALAPGLIRSVK